MLLKLEGYLSVPTFLQNHHLTPLQSLLWSSHLPHLFPHALSPSPIFLALSFSPIISLSPIILHGVGWYSVNLAYVVLIVGRVMHCYHCTHAHKHTHTCNPNVIIINQCAPHECEVTMEQRTLALYVIIMLVFVSSLPFVLLLLFIINALYFVATDTHLIVA